MSKYNPEYQHQYYLKNRERLRAYRKEKYIADGKQCNRPSKKDRKFLYLRYYYDGKQLCHGLVVNPQPGDYKFKNMGVVVK